MELEFAALSPEQKDKVIDVINTHCHHEQIKLNEVITIYSLAVALYNMWLAVNPDVSNMTASAEFLKILKAVSNDYVRSDKSRRTAVQGGVRESFTPHIFTFVIAIVVVIMILILYSMYDTVSYRYATVYVILDSPTCDSQI